MCDFAPRQSCDISLAILQLVAATAGIITPRPVVAISDAVLLLADPPAAKPSDLQRDFASEVVLIVADVNTKARTTPEDSTAVIPVQAHPSGVRAGEGESR